MYIVTHLSVLPRNGVEIFKYDLMILCQKISYHFLSDFNINKLVWRYQQIGNNVY